MWNADYGKYEKGSFPLESKFSLRWARRLILTGATEKRWAKETPITIEFLAKNELEKKKDEKLTFLDFGMGIGRISLPLLKKYPNIRVVGIDASRSMLKLAKKYIPEKYFRDGRIKLYHLDEMTRLMPESIDIITACYVFQHIYKEELEKILPALWRLVKDSGKLFVVGTFHGDDNKARIVNIRRIIDRYFKPEVELGPQNSQAYWQWMKIAGYGDWEKGILASGRCRKFQAIFSKRKTLEPNLADIVQEEKRSLEAFFGRKIKVPKPDFSQDEVRHWRDIGFDLHYLPQIKLSEKANFPGWHERPHKVFFEKVGQRKISQDSLWLPGKWILIDSRPKPRKRVFWQSSSDPFLQLLKFLGARPKEYFKRYSLQQYQDDFLLPTLQKFGFGSRFSSSWQDWQKFKPEIARLLGVRTDEVRLARFIEFNFLGNIFYPEWRETHTWEWLEDRFSDKYRLAGGYGSLGIVGWDPEDFWSTILGFRPLVELT